MNAEKMFQLIKNSFKSAILVGLLLGAISFLILVVTQKSFRSSIDVIIAQNQEGKVDYYEMSRSADYLSSILTEAIYSEKFLDEVNSTGKNSGDFLIGDKAKKIKKWEKIINVKKNAGVGIMKLEIFGDTQNQVGEVSNGVLDVLINKNSLFFGKGQNLEVRVLSGPIIEKNPSFGKIAVTSVGGFVVGILLTFLFVIYREEYFEKDTLVLRNNFENSLLNYSGGENDQRENLATNENSVPNYFNSENNISFSENSLENLESFNEVKEQEKSEISTPDYLSEDSDYWKERLKNRA